MFGLRQNLVLGNILIKILYKFFQFFFLDFLNQRKILHMCVNFQET